jgi:hypothetical protein
LGLVTTIKTRGLLWATVHAANWAFDWVFNYILYPYVLIKLGLITGTAIMMVLSFFICWGFVRLYDWVSMNWVRDALGFETIKEAVNDLSEWLERRQTVGRIARESKPAFKSVSFLYFTLIHDPMVCLILMRPRHTHMMGKDEWKIFLGSVFLSNVTWGLMVWVGVETIQSLFPALWQQLV